MTAVATVDWFEGPREELRALFALADDSATAVDGYRHLGRVLVARDGTGIIGHLQLIVSDDLVEAEVRSVAVREDRQGAGVGRMLMERAIAVSRQENRARLLVATAAADVHVLRFYQLLGFRLLHVKRDVFTRDRGYPEIDIDGIPLRDQVWLALDFGNTDLPAARREAMQLRVARHTDDLDALVRFYRDGVGLAEIGRFSGHAGYDGVFLEVPGTGAHLELTAGGDRGAPVPHPESLLVLYVGNQDSVDAIAARLGTPPVVAANPYWATHGVTVEDPDGFRVVLVPESWQT
jgi:GNAT superfamily N-acetyltransferase